MRKIIIDCDPGHDDAIAILIAYANSRQLKVLGITTVCGNQTIDKVTTNALKIVDFLNWDIPVSKGADKPLKRVGEPQPLAHGESGMDGPTLPDVRHKLTGINAVEWMKDTLIKEEKVTLVCMGPLTNVGILLEKYPEVKKHIEEIVIMGGSIYGGNIQVKSEFNIYHDPDGAKIVFNSKVPLTMAPIEVCEAGAFKLKDMEYFKDKGRASELVYDLLKFYSKWSVEHHCDRTPIFDMTTIIYLLHPEYFTSRIMNVDIELAGQYTRGMTVCEEIKEFSLINNPIKVLIDVDNKLHNQVFIDAVDYLDKQDI